MLLVETHIGPSKIAGIGLFAKKPIAKGTRVWELNKKLDMRLTKAEVAKLSEPAQAQVKHDAYLDTKHKALLLCGDDARFFNHSSKPNCDESQPDVTTAIRDIKAGEELTVDYGVFYGNIDEHQEVTNRDNTCK